MRNSWKVLIPMSLLLAVSLGLLVYPIYVIRPFRYQGPAELAWALAVIQVRPWLQVALASGAVASAIWTWRQRIALRVRIAAWILGVLVIASAVLSQINIYEMLFHPLDRPAFAAAAKAKLDGREEVIAIKLRNIARAYPIRIISYHHIVNDVVAGIPVVATY